MQFRGQQKNIALSADEAKDLQSIVELERNNVESDRVARRIPEKSEYERKLERLSEKLDS